MYVTLSVPKKTFKLFGVSVEERKRHKSRNLFVKKVMKDEFFDKTSAKPHNYKSAIIDEEIGQP